jgi:hypothetical protein
MLTQQDFEWCAKVLIDQFGAGAAGRAEIRARDLQQQGDRDGYAVWQEVAATVRRIQAETASRKLSVVASRRSGRRR